MNNTLRLPAEWEASQAILMAWPHEGTDWAHMLEDIRRCYADIIAAAAARAKVILIGPEEPNEKYMPAGDLRNNVIFFNIPTNDTWTRDYGAITCVRTDQNGNSSFEVNDFMFNGWGLKFASDCDNLATLRLFDKGVFVGKRVNRLGFVLEGGSIESDGAGTMLTTTDCLLSPNRNGDLNLEQVEERLKEMFNLHTIHWLTKGALEGDDTDGHIDTLARLAPPGDVIFYTGCHDEADSHYECLNAMYNELRELRTADGRPFNLIELPLPDPIYDPDDEIRLPATYANFLILNGAVLLPIYNQPMKDLMAQMAVKAAMPEYDVVSIDCRALIRQHGSLHCATMQFPANSLNIK